MLGAAAAAIGIVIGVGVCVDVWSGNALAESGDGGASAVSMSPNLVSRPRYAIKESGRHMRRNRDVEHV
jgi:hypothetical protein